MKKRLMILSAVMVALILFLVAGSTLAEPLSFSLPWWTVDGGGGTSSGGDFALSGTIGQPEAGEVQGGNYTLGGSFWGGGSLPADQYNIYLPLIFKQN